MAHGEIKDYKKKNRDDQVELLVCNKLKKGGDKWERIVREEADDDDDDDGDDDNDVDNDDDDDDDGGDDDSDDDAHHHHCHHEPVFHLRYKNLRRTSKRQWRKQN
eukprot:154547-Karenia_brevis.AAC.1